MQLLQIDSSARFEPSDANPRGSHTRRLTQRFVQRWLQSRPGDRVVSRDLGRFAPGPVTDGWVKAAFAKPDRREPWMSEALAESDALVDELTSADLIVAGVPMYNFGVPAQFKAYIDNVVRVGRTFGFDRSRPDDPYSALLAGMDKRLVLLGSRGDYGYDPGGRMAAVNHVEGAVRDVFAFIGITAFHSIAVEYDEFADDRLQASIAAAERAVDDLVDELLKLTKQRTAA
ncbi:FMN-dependent NADH-azoreductase [Bradyrhizobium yuanmingense]|uniref:FMN-dependent NADH-azoreductase n=1 Tax=Bradyrhizobium yuanmingense TaxID=108015 RepID=UPI0023BA1326|nr:NAD(P)H-dependent oxidoreductase [Bradyrhizobium yuanmingense]MDF0581158.1 NAD(P)H-dependent oxidoreductase [Bradyrhizobium yuanmingense]